VYRNNGPAAYTLNATQIEIFGANQGLQDGGVVLGDLNGDGNVDAVVTGNRGAAATRQILVARNNGGLAFTQITVDAGSGLDFGKPALGDFDNDGDLDLLVSGQDPAGQFQLRVYRNNGDATFDPAQIEVPGAANNGYAGKSSVAWGDYDKDGDLDVLTVGDNFSGSTSELRIYKNNGNGTIDTAQIEVESRGGGLRNGGVAWGDFDNDGDLDILTCGTNSGGDAQLRVYKNNGNGTINSTPVEIEGTNNGVLHSRLSWGDYDTDGDLDILGGGYWATPSWVLGFRVYKNNGNGTFDSTEITLSNVWVKGQSQ
jgi:hypothetical protein